jgi:hypothetical protein
MKTIEALGEVLVATATHRLPPGGTDLIAPHVADVRIVQTAPVAI